MELAYSKGIFCCFKSYFIIIFFFPVPLFTYWCTMPRSKASFKITAELSRELVRARAARDSVVRSIRNVFKLSADARCDVSEQQLFVSRADTVDKYINQFEEHQCAILNALVDIDRVDEFNTVDALIADEFEHMCGSIRSALQLLKPASLNNFDKSINEGPAKAVHAVSFPKFDLPKFDGNITDWCSFRDTYVDLVHNNVDIPVIMRFHLLTSCLSGPPLTIIKSVPLTADNYTIAWEALKARYENKRLLATKHLDKIFAFSPIKKESVASLSLFINTFRENITAIRKLGIEDVSGFILFYIGSRVLDTETRRLFEASSMQTDIPKLEELLDFVSKRVHILENIGTDDDKNEIAVKVTAKKGKWPITGKSSFATTSLPQKSFKCSFCQQDHLIYRCFVFKKKSVFERRKFVSSKGLCFICLRSGHSASTCTSDHKCKHCEGKHSTLLHEEKRNFSQAEGTSSEKQMASSSSTTDKAADVSQKFSGSACVEATVVLGTAIVRIKDTAGEFQTVRVMLDSGSQVSAITSEVVSRLGLKKSKSRMEVVGLAQQPVTHVKGVTSCTFVPLVAHEPCFVASNVVILPQITKFMPSSKLPSAVRERYRHLILADPNFDVPCSVDMLIGSDLYPFLLQPKADIIHSPGLPSAMSTHLGWIIVGSLQEASESPLLSLALRSESTIEDLLQTFWTVEEPSVSAQPTTEEERCEKWFGDTFMRDETGRFYVGLPFRRICSDEVTSKSDTAPQECNLYGLGSSRMMALNRLYNLERKLQRDPELYDAYRSFMDEYLSLGHMKLATSPGKYYIPHHAVVKRSDDNMKIRVVFDASAKSSSGLSLNDCLATGPKLQSEIGDILLRSRFHKYLFICDISKMYRQIRVHEEDCQYQHILWRRSPNEEVREFELTTVTYGVNSAPFLAIRCLHQLDDEDGPKYAKVHGLLRSNTYVDDIVAGANSVGDALTMQQELINLLNCGGFELKKWASNCVEVLEKIPTADRTVDLCFQSKEKLVKVLGLRWDPEADLFGYHVEIEQDKVTKRAILSTIARLYDPVGILSPVIFWAKGFMQELWCNRLSWDSPVSSVLAAKWNQFLQELPALSKVHIPRFIDIRCVKEIQLVGFSDASQRGYAALVFLRVIDNDEQVNVHFITCKTKVAPLKSSKIDTSLTIPRLELCGALLLARVLSNRLKIINEVIKVDRVRAWTDSSIVLGWINQEPKQFKVFVTNRITKIRELLPQCEWAHINSKENAADPASRGLLPSELQACKLHVNGSQFLKLSEDKWPTSSVPTVAPEELPEFKAVSKLVLHHRSDEDSEVTLRRFSSLLKMQRVLAYCLRFGRKIKQRSQVDSFDSLNGPLSRAELDYALMVAIKLTQNIYYSQLQKQLQQAGTPITPSSLAQLAPFQDHKGIIRVGGRIKHALIPANSRHPILLPKHSYLTELIIRHYHLSLLHAGPRLVSTMINKRYWIVSSRAAIRQVIHSCIPCVRFRATCPQPVMADLPPVRVQPNRPFSFVGLDYGGPFLVKENRRRNSKTHKIYLSLFICLSTKALHLETVTDISSEAFLAAFDRFTARRGFPVELYSDCGTNYVGAARQMKALFDDQSTQDSVQSRTPCVWKFNPPAAPHFGGIWEAAIKSTKSHLKKVIGAQVFTMEEFTTLIYRIEGILNSRPLTPISSDPSDLEALSPGHFLIGQPIMSLPDTDVRDVPMNRLNRWQLVKQTQQSFWSRWSQEYLTTLQGRQKWFSSCPTLAIGDMVVVNSPSRPLMSWQLGRIVDVHPGSDDVVRVATVQTADGVLKRPVVKLVKLPV